MSRMVLSHGIGQGLAEVGTDRLHPFRCGMYRCLTWPAEELCELTDALLSAEGPMKTIVDLSLAPEHHRGHGALYDGFNSGHVDADRLRGWLVGVPVPRTVGRRIVLAEPPVHLLGRYASIG